MARYSVPVVRVPVGGSCDVCLLGDEVIVLGTHFLGRRLPCIGENCPACMYDEPREFVYRLCRSESDGRVRLLEVPYVSWLAARTLEVGDATLRGGTRLRLSRKHKRSPVIMEVFAVREDGHFSPQLTLGRCLLCLFGLGLASAEDSVALALHKCRLRCEAKLVQAMRKCGLEVHLGSGKVIPPDDLIA